VKCVIGLKRMNERKLELFYFISTIFERRKYGKRVPKN
jgi:hypothetical protein